jgi:uncharacterized protein YjbJ (UPF0337 family)
VSKLKENDWTDAQTQENVGSKTENGTNAENSNQSNIFGGIKQKFNNFKEKTKKEFNKVKAKFKK